jgi:hypothetical protein
MMESLHLALWNNVAPGSGGKWRLPCGQSVAQPRQPGGGEGSGG